MTDQPEIDAVMFQAACARASEADDHGCATNEEWAILYALERIEALKADRDKFRSEIIKLAADLLKGRSFEDDDPVDDLRRITAVALRKLCDAHQQQGGEES